MFLAGYIQATGAFPVLEKSDENKFAVYLVVDSRTTRMAWTSLCRVGERSLLRRAISMAQA